MTQLHFKIIIVGIGFVTLSMFCVSCGSGETVNIDYQAVNTEKLVGTPFEGLTTGDSIDPMTLLCGQYRTETINSFPIPIFAALFNYGQELSVQEGIEMANEGMGFTAYEYTETWRDDARVIYAVNEIDATTGDAVGMIEPLFQTFNGKQYAEKIATDWAIRITFLPAAYIIAHELGHASGIYGHILIDYENDAELELEPGSIMESGGGYSSILDDYNFMMLMQGQIMQDHLGEAGTIVDTESCP
jgi:hypothetical protein